MSELKAVIYARYSSSSQREESIEGQIRDCTAYAERNGSVHRYYKCHASKKKLNDCRKKPIKKEEIENLVVNETMAMPMRLQDEETSDLPIFEKQLRNTETAIDNIVTAIMGGISSNALQTKLAQLEAAKEEILIRIDEEKLEKPKISAEFMTFWLHRFRKLDVTKEAHRQMLIDTFVNAVSYMMTSYC